MNATWSKEELRKIRKSLPTGWQTTLAAEFSLSAGRVDNILSGQSPKDEVILRAIEVASAFQSQKEKAIGALASL